MGRGRPAGRGQRAPGGRPAAPGPAPGPAGHAAAGVPVPRLPRRGRPGPVRAPARPGTPGPGRRRRRRGRRDAHGGALGLWRGPALADFRYEPFAQADIARLEELRLVCLEERIEADLALGAAGELVGGELQRLVGEHPLRERLRGQLMLALYRSGRQAEALEVYRDVRELLLDELGLEPAPALGELEGAILRHDPALRTTRRRSRPRPRCRRASR